MAITTDNFKWLQVEISAFCQAGCIDCNRWRPRGGYLAWETGTPTEWQLNGDHPHMNSVYDVAVWRQHIQQFHSVRHLQFVGNMGDPMAHPHIVECCEIVRKHLPNCTVDISTNGGLGQIETYVKLANLGVEVTFAIDGLEDTNHIYRRGVDWHKAKQRFTAYIQAGGQAQWQWVDFPHTRHQIDTARQLAKQWGFNVFDVRPRYTPDQKFDSAIIAASSQPVDLRSRHQNLQQDDLDQQYRHMLEEMSHLRVEPRCANVPDVDYYHPCPHINVDGTLWPCCFTANIPFHASPAIQHWWQKVSSNFPNHWNSLSHFTPQQILESEWWSQLLPDSWKTNTNRVCLEQCGGCIK